MSDSIYPNNLHHAYGIEGNPENVRQELRQLFEHEWGITLRGNPDFSDETFGVLGVEEVRALKEKQSKKAFGGGKKIFLIEAESITLEAQNSFLKTLEEPTANTHFFIFGGSVKNLIPTLASRLSRIRGNGAALSTAGGGVLEFLKAPLPERLALVKKLADDIKDEKKTRGHALALLQGIEAALYQKTRNQGELPGKLFADLEMCREYMTDRAPSVKMLLEYVAIVAPRI